MTAPFASALTKIAVSVAAAACIGGGGAVLRASEINAVQDTRITTLEKNVGEISELRKEIAQTNQTLAVTNTLLEKQSHEPSNR